MKKQSNFPRLSCILDAPRNWILFVSFRANNERGENRGGDLYDPNDCSPVTNFRKLFFSTSKKLQWKLPNIKRAKTQINQRLEDQMNAPFEAIWFGDQQSRCTERNFASFFQGKIINYCCIVLDTSGRSEVAGFL